jgi:hypothetical protein
MNRRYRLLSYIAPLAIASAVGCAGTGDPSESTGETTEAVTSSGMTASITITSKDSQSYHATVTVTNLGAEPASNWQVGLNLNQATLQQGTFGAEVATIANQSVFTPNSNAKVLSPGGSVTFNYSTAITGANYLPTIAAVDGVANGTAGAGFPADGVDRIARAVATGALNVAEAYEANKLPNTGDANYANYDGLIWSAQSYIISGNEIVFDPNVPGYAFVPVQAVAQLAAMQDNPSVASYLTSGLASCFADTSGALVYNFKAGVLKGFTYPGPLAGTLPGGTPPSGDYVPPGYNPNVATDTFTATGAAVNGAEQITVTMKSSADYWFGILTSSNINSFPNSSAVVKKFTNGNGTSCSPFNGPGGGTSNPFLVITLNGKVVQARYQGTGAQCQNGCTATMVLDPAAYATAGADYNASGLVGPQPNPFAFDPTQSAATTDHFGQWGTTTSQTGLVAYGTFTVPIIHSRVTTGYGWLPTLPPPPPPPGK